MKRILASNTHLVHYTNNEFFIYDPISLSLLKSFKSVSSVFALFHSTLFYTEDDSVISYNLVNDNRISFKTKKVSSLFPFGIYLYVGLENGTINVYSYNSHLFKLTNTFIHTGPILSLAADGSTVFVADYRNKVTFYPEQKSFDFQEPTLYFSRYIFCASKNQLYTKTREAFGYLFSTGEQIQDVVFSPKGGLLFIRTEKGVSCYDSLGNEKFHTFPREFVVVTVDNYCKMVYFEGGVPRLEECYIKDVELDEILFKEVKIEERKIQAEEYDNREGKEEKRTTNRRSRRRVVVKEASSPSESEESTEEYSDRGRARRSMLEDSDEDSEHSNGDTNRGGSSKHSVTTGIATTVPMVADKITVNDTTLLCFNQFGSVLSVNSELSNKIIIKFHDSTFDTIVFKDDSKATMADFTVGSFVLSNGSVLNFNNQWSKQIKSTFISITSSYVFSMGDTLTVFSHSGDIIREVAVSECVSFCSSESLLACFFFSNLALFQGGFGSCSYIPVRGVTFSCFHNSTLFVSIGQSLFRFTNNYFEKVCDFTGIPVYVNGDHLIVLAHPTTFFPNINLNYIPLGVSVTQKTGLASDRPMRFNPYMN